MANELTEMGAAVLLETGNISLSPTLFNEETSLANYTKLPISGITSLGAAFEPLSNAVRKVFGGKGATSSLYNVTIPSGTHLAQFKDGTGNLGTVLNANNQIAGQAKLTPLKCNPTMVFMAAALANIEKKLDAIKELQQEMMDFLVRKEKAELRGDLIFLADILNNYRFNWNNDMYKNSNHIKVLDIRQAAEQKILFYRDQIASILRKKSSIHIGSDVRKQIDAVRSALTEYQLALYTLGFSAFLDVMLVGNYAAGYLNGIKQKIEDYSLQYRELYKECCDQSKAYFSSSVESTLLKGLGSLSRAAGQAIAKIPYLSEGPVDEALIEAGNKLDKLEAQRAVEQLRKLDDHQGSCVRPFLENIETVKLLYSHSISMVFDQENVYLGIAEENS
ncbi:MAG: hypothetical protein II875_09310 [Clostridia bacterium]|nr:hypothetical protein [Clostridia bacterium]